jgi:hypothetical protein
MPLSTELLAGETAASFVFHAILPLVIGYFILKSVNIVTVMATPMVLLVLVVPFLIVSFFAQMGLYAALQSNACSGIQNVSSIMKSAGIATAITVPFVIAPVLIEGLRLLISQVVITHKPLAVLHLAEMNNVTLDAAAEIGTIARGPSDAAVDDPSGDAIALLPDAYKRQTFKEIAVACSYMSAFGAAIGFAAGGTAGGVTFCKPAAAGGS